MKLRRSMLFVPGSNAAMLSNSFIYKPDSIMFDLEDAVALKEKDSARLLVAHALQHPLYQEIETVVRVNPLDSEFGLLDLNAVVRAGVDVVRMPKTETAQDVVDMDNAITDIEKACGREVGSTKMLAAIESPLGITQANQIATAYKRVCTVLLRCLCHILGNLACAVSKVLKLEHTYGTVPKDGLRVENDFLPDGQRLFRGVHTFPSVGYLVDGHNLTIGVIVELIGCNGSHRQA